jgi:DNA-binding transcriptional regulator YhcF (GntR family)
MNREFGAPTKSEIIVASVSESIRKGDFSEGQVIPSINRASKKFQVARKTVIRAYEKLVEQGFIEARPQKGYFVVNRQPETKLRVLLVIHSFDAHFQVLYNEFREKVKEICEIEIYFHHYNIKILDLIISRNSSVYDLFIISSFDHPQIPSVIGRIPAGKLLIISRNDRLGNKYNSIIQNFFEGTYLALKSAKEKISRYSRFILSFPEKSGHPQTLKAGFQKFVNDYKLAWQISDSLDEFEICKGDAFLVIDDADLVKLLRVCKTRGWKLGRDVGVIAYNETSLKEVIRDGITVISCNFSSIANGMSNFILHRNAVHDVIPISLINRKSL